MKHLKTLSKVIILIAVVLGGCAVTPQQIDNRIHSDPALSVAFSPDGRLVAVGSTFSLVVLRDAKTQDIKLKLHGEHLYFVKMTRSFVPINDYGVPMAFSPDSRWLATQGVDCESAVNVWDSDTGAKVSDMHGSNCGADLLTRFMVRSLAFSPDGSQLAVAFGSLIIVLDPRYGTLIRQTRAHRGDVIALAYTPDGGTIVSGGEDGVLRFWSSKSSEFLREVGGFSSSVTGVCLMSTILTARRQLSWPVGGGERI